eukprot:11901701-Ditylum_brightwellii.AAC.1
MLVEDEYILNDAYIAAIGTLVEYADSDSSKEFLEERQYMKRKLIGLRGGVKIESQKSVYCRNESLKRFSLEDIKTDVLGRSNLEHSGVAGTDFVSVFECNRGDVTMERF